MTGEDNIGSTLRGIGPCYADKIGRSFAIRIGDMVRDDFPDRVRKIVEVKTKVLSAAGSQEIGSLDAEQIITEYTDYANRLKEMITDTNQIVLDAVDADKAVLFEGAQGSLLDIDHGTFPFVTSSNASGTGISSGSGAPGSFLKRIIGVCKCYSTRVGGGPFPTEQDNETGEHIRQMGKEFGTTTGRPRRCGWFDAVAVRYTTRLGGVTSVALTMLDVLSELEEIKICTGYELDGKTIDWFPAHPGDLKNLVPIYESVEGWQQDVTGARTVEDLPEKAIAFCLRLQELIGRPIEFISVGPDRAQTIDVKDLALEKV